MSSTINLSGEGSHGRVAGKFLVNHITVAQALYEPDADDHHKIISCSNVWAIDVVNAQYVAGNSVRTGQVAIPTTKDTGLYIVLDDGYDPACDLYPVNEKNMTSGLIIVVLDPDNVCPSSKLTRMLIDGVAYVDEAVYKEMLAAIDK
ncbi:hypothetical protein EM858_19930 [Agrobacterium sp. CNPSo 2736]|uniref:hypothetical protein n=1 Tax=Agrobacterium sp. CNPSo 2736 TaxID=2499627 RepID=UPI000FD98CC8|nr:hypothetical protein [Agrobacterium sp. CNPSo 2736]RVT73047.1 hypothetical protein EM858_19930 [Agrobacterium sp. CNPSo 2736]